MKKICFLLMTALIAVSMNAQVGINTESPNANTALDVVSPRNNQGIMIPRMTEAQRNAISTSAADNSLMVYNTDEDCFNYYSKSDGEWKSVCGGVAKAVFEPGQDCSQYVVHGTYIKNKALDNSNYLTITVNVIKAGAYSINVDAVYDAAGTLNGYGFTGSGTFLNTGLQTINLQAQGKPINVHCDPVNPAVGDALKFIAQGTVRTVPGCVTVPVVDNISEYSISCSSVSVNGTYIKGTGLGSGNTITITVTVSTAGSYSIEGSSNSGISFKATGFFSSAGSHTVTLTGIGTPTVNTDIPITIQANSPKGNTFCSAVAKITLPPMTYAIIGNDIYSWNTDFRRRAFTRGYAFGTSGVVKVASLTNLWTESSAAGAVTRMGQTVKPDIILYFAYGAAPTANLSNLLANYVRAGGVLIYGSADNDVTGTDNILNGIFGAGAGTAGNVGSDDNDYMINMLPNDPIINGPFGNLSGKFWGEDNSGSVYTRQLPPNSVQICSANNQMSNAGINPDYSMIWYNENLNFVYLGDCTGSDSSNTSGDGWPTIYNTNGMPVSKQYGRYSSSVSQRPYIHNPVLELNAVAWAIKKAASSGINPH